MISSVIDGSPNPVGVRNPKLTGESSMTIAKPPVRYGAYEGARPVDFATPTDTTAGDVTSGTTSPNSE